MDKLITLNRRELLKNTTGLLTGLVVAGTPLALMAHGRAWAVDLTAFTSSSFVLQSSSWRCLTLLCVVTWITFLRRRWELYCHQDGNYI